MCQASGKLQIYVDDKERGYMKGRAGKSWYIPPSGQEKLRQWARNNQGNNVDIELVRGMLVKVMEGSNY